MAKKNASQQRLRPKDRIESFWVMINLGVARYWKVSADGIEKCGAPADHQGPVLTFDETSDFRYFSPKKARASDARSYFLTEYQEKCRVFAAGPHVYYGTPSARLMQFGHSLYPGAYYIDALLEKNRVTLEQDRVVGLSLQVGGADEFNIVVLFARRHNGEMSPPTVALNPPDLQLTIREFADQYKASDVDPILFGVNDILGLPVGVGYPMEDMLFGTPVRNIARAIATILGGLTLASGSVSGYHYAQAMRIMDDANKQQRSVVTFNKKVETLLEGNIHAFARLNSVETDKLFKHAESLWNKYSLVTYGQLDRQQGVLRAYIPVQEVSMDTSGRAIQKLNDFAEIQKQLNRPTDGELTRSKTTLTQDTNAYEVEYNFKSLGSDFSPIVGVK